MGVANNSQCGSHERVRDKMKMFFRSGYGAQGLPPYAFQSLTALVVIFIYM